MDAKRLWLQLLIPLNKENMIKNACNIQMIPNLPAVQGKVSLELMIEPNKVEVDRDQYEWHMEGFDNMNGFFEVKMNK